MPNEDPERQENLEASLSTAHSRRVSPPSRISFQSLDEDGLRRLTPERPYGGTSETEPSRLDEGYYLDNFLAVLRTVEEHSDDLLRGDERSFAADFHALEVPAQRLYVRLISRRGPCFRRDRLSYPEIEDLDGALDALRASGFLDNADDEPPSSLLSLLLRGELVAMAEELLPEPPSKTGRKDRFQLTLLDKVPSPDLDRALRQRIHIVRPQRHEVLLVFRLLYFGNLHQDWTEFVLRDLGVVRFESYDLQRDLRRFDCRLAVDDHILIRHLNHHVYQALAGDDADLARSIAGYVAASRSAWHPLTERRQDGLLLTVARQLERLGAWDDALELYDQVSTPPSRERRVRVLERQQRLDDAIQLCDAIAEAPRDESEAVFAPRFGHRLRRLRGDDLPTWKRPRRPRRDIKVPKRPDMSVERQALLALADEGIDGFFAENWLWKSLFGLAFWDIVFAPVPGAFQHPFQYGPLDQSEEDFRPRRQALIEARLQWLRDQDNLTAPLLERYDAKEGIANPWVSWHEELRRRLVLALEHLDGHQLAAICDRLSRHPGRYRRGFPDLFVWKRGERSFMLYEVKGPGDQLRPEQGAWIDYLNKVGIEASVLRLKWE